MRDYTYIEGYRFNIWNVYRSKRFDVDRLDINWADKDKPEFIRGLRQVEDDVWLVSFMDYDMAYFDMESSRVQALENPFGPKVLGM